MSALKQPQACVPTDSRNQIKGCKFINVSSKCLGDNKFSRSYLGGEQDVRGKEQAPECTCASRAGPSHHPGQWQQPWAAQKMLGTPKSPR